MEPMKILALAIIIAVVVSVVLYLVATSSDRSTKPPESHNGTRPRRRS